MDWIVYDVYSDKQAFQRKEKIERHLILWIGGQVDLQRVKVVCQNLTKPYLLVIAQGSDQVFVSVSFEKPLSSILPLDIQFPSELNGLEGKSN